MTKVKINEEEFRQFSKYILDISGISLDKGKEYLLETRLNPMMARFGCTSFSELLQKAKSDSKRVIENAVIDAISTNETYFFRDKTPFELLQHKIFPDLIDKRSRKNPGMKPSIRLWSAASSTGQEIYSIAMILVEMGITPDRYNIRLLGTDISDDAVAKASYGKYNKFEVSRGLDKKRLDRFFDKQGDYYRIKDQIRVMAQFKKLNLMKPLTGIGTHDIILCRNVMIYFNPAARQRIYGNIAKSLESDGYLLIGSTESLSNDTDLFVSKKYLRSIFYQFK